MEMEISKRVNDLNILKKAVKYDRDKCYFFYCTFDRRTSNFIISASFNDSAYPAKMSICRFIYSAPLLDILIFFSKCITKAKLLNNN